MVRVFALEKFEKESARFRDRPELQELMSVECTGVLIAPRLILTAGHCVCITRFPSAQLDTKAVVAPRKRAPSTNKYKYDFIKDKIIEAVMDEKECASRVEVETVTYGEGRTGSFRPYNGVAIAHPKFELYFTKSKNTAGESTIGASWVDSDLAVVVLDEPVTGFPIYEPEWNNPPTGHEIIMIGYGEGDTYPKYGHRHAVENKVTGFTRSESKDIRIIIQAQDAPDGGFTAFATRGDSGGGCVSKTSPTKLLGISSSTTTFQSRKISEFTSVNAHKAWLQKQLDTYSDPISVGASGTK